MQLLSWEDDSLEKEIKAFVCSFLCWCNERLLYCNILGFSALDLSINQLPYVNVSATFYFPPNAGLLLNNTQLKQRDLMKSCNKFKLCVSLINKSKISSKIFKNQWFAHPNSKMQFPVERLLSKAFWTKFIRHPWIFRH